MIRLPKIAGTMDRRILINYRVDPSILKSYLPAPFEPWEINGVGIVGICLIRLKHTRPKGIPGFMGISSENGAHRIAVKWKEGNTYKYGVYIPRRDTNSWLNALAGDRVFPGKHYLSSFKVSEQEGNYDVAFEHQDGTHLQIKATATKNFPKESVFQDINTASLFFEEGYVGYSPADNHCFDCVALKTYNWKVSPLHVSDVKSSFFSNEEIFPKGSIQFDSALLMKSIKHEWHVRKTMKAG